MRAIFHGKVQGVFFRREAEQVAIEYALIGFVRNLSDGSVELVAHGEKNSLEQFVLILRNKFEISSIELNFFSTFDILR